MEQNDKDTLEAEKQQMNGQTEEAPQETTTPEEPANTSENNSDTHEQEKSEDNAEKNEEETIVSNGDEEENANEEKDEEEDELGDGFQPSVEMSIRLFEKDKGDINRPISRQCNLTSQKQSDHHQIKRQSLFHHPSCCFHNFG
ncbi:glutamic acid-rich protein-like [Sinocyclocheilus anshuiensis]|uniref:glutamic acid-rich protein-like n=1 Tax=Sinocyclocheilus anshuiensis TaxID=1608454 RepID=UPI0007B8702E|nr:PREDICTED: glutamic acid-rich protein-like [Sinocyclocheilus anshuiensis]